MLALLCGLMGGVVVCVCVFIGNTFYIEQIRLMGGVVVCVCVYREHILYRTHSVDNAFMYPPPH